MGNIEIGRSREKQPHPCIFCNIRDGGQEASRVVENESAFAIMSLEGYPLVIPNTHITLKNLPQHTKEMGKAFELAATLVEATMKTLNASGVNVIANFGKSAGQHVPHAHIHVMNRNTQDEQIKFGKQYALQREELNNRATAIRKSLRV